MRAATEGMQMGTAVAAAEERCSWSRASRARKKRAKVSSIENVATAQESVTHGAATVRSGQEGSVAVIEDIIAPTSEAAVCKMPTDVRSVQVTGDVGSQRLIRGVDARQEAEDEVAEVVLGLGGQVHAAVADAVTVVDPAQALMTVWLRWKGWSRS